MGILEMLIFGFITISIIYGLLIIVFFIKQERFIFYPLTLEKGHVFEFSFPFEERVFTPEKGVRIHSILAHSTEKKGLIFYLHSNSGNLNRWGNDMIPDLLGLGYDVFMMDYRSYGKSIGKISQEALINDVDYVYNELIKEYPEVKIHLFGKSIGASLAAYLAAHYFPNQLIMETPFYSMKELSKYYFPWLPSFLLKYRFNTYQYCFDIQHSTPITLFHGTADEIIPHDSSLKLKEKLHNQKINLYLIPKGRHNNLPIFKSYHTRLTQILP